MISFRGQKKGGPVPGLVSFRGLIQNFWRASPLLWYGNCPPGACTRIYTVCIWSRHLKLYWRKWSLIQTDFLDETFTFNYSLNWSFSEHTVACVNLTMLCCVTAVCLCKIIEKSVMGWSSTRFSIACSWFLILDLFRNRELWISSRIKTRNGLSTFFWTVL